MTLPYHLPTLCLNDHRKWYLIPDNPELLRFLQQGFEVIVEKQVRKYHLQLMRYKEAAWAVVQLVSNA
jgi:hypothetical protein